MQITMPHLLLIILAIVPLLSGCRQETSGQAPTLILKNRSEQQDCSLEIYADKDSLELSDTLKLTIQVKVPEGMDCRIEDFTSSLQGFRLKSGDTLPWCDKSSTPWTYRLILEAEPLIAENHQIDSLTAIVSPLSSSGNSEEIQLHSQPFSLDIAMPPQETWDNLNINDQDGMQSIHTLKLPLRVIFVLLLIIVLLAALLIFLWKFKASHPSREKLPPPVPPHITALRRLDELLAEKLPEQEQFKLFYQRISSLTRTYIEDRYEIRAPELTTEEFLHQLSACQTALAAHRPALEHFLSFCDLVKFAEHTPQASDIVQTAEACRTFIISTSSSGEANNNVPL